MVIGKERTDLGRPDDVGYPIRGIVTDRYIYLRNYHPERWPAGNPETGYMDCDGSPTKTWILNDRRTNGKSNYWNLSFGKWPAEELYSLPGDRECLKNLATDKEFSAIKKKLTQQMQKKLRKDKDPRMFGNGDEFEKYPYSQDNRNFYNRVMAGEKLKANWIEQTDIEKEKIK